MEKSKPKEERRRYERYDVVCPATLLKGVGVEEVSSQTDNLSDMGCLVRAATGSKVKARQRLELGLMIPRQTANSYMLEPHKIKACVVRVEGEAGDEERVLALEFDKPQGFQLDGE